MAEFVEGDMQAMCKGVCCEPGVRCCAAPGCAAKMALMKRAAEYVRDESESQ